MGAFEENFRVFFWKLSSFQSVWSYLVFISSTQFSSASYTRARPLFFDFCLHLFTYAV
jgi:hypothetical protein